MWIRTPFTSEMQLQKKKTGVGGKWKESSSKAPEQKEKLPFLVFAKCKKGRQTSSTGMRVKDVGLKFVKIKKKSFPREIAMNLP